VIHSFSGPLDYGEQLIDMGFAVSFSGLVFRKGEEPSAEVARRVPGSRLLVETDAPFLSPPGTPRSRNLPEHVSVTARWVADQRGVPDEALGDDLVAAYDRVFVRPLGNDRSRDGSWTSAAGS
jgi:TatD DNase family protein